MLDASSCMLHEHAAGQNNLTPRNNARSDQDRIHPVTAMLGDKKESVSAADPQTQFD